MPLPYIFHSIWSWLVSTGFSLALLIVLAFLVPRLGRLAMRIIERKVEDEDVEESKTHLAFAGVAVYIAQLIGYFVIFVFILQQLGFSLAGAAIPATAASAAIGLGAQSIIADFLAGFFILSEKQYGVGDWVRFEGGATTQEGTVIQITMRATRIRTLADETVIIPNSKAGVSINSSNYWSSAVVVMPIPLLGSSSIREAIDRVTAAGQRAIANPKVAKELLGELSVQEPTGVNAPTTVGMPWTVNIRLITQVKPGSQWFVERSIRTAIIDEFWEEYGSAPTFTGSVATSLNDVQETTQLAPLTVASPDSEARTEILPAGAGAGTDAGTDSGEALPTEQIHTQGDSETPTRLDVPAAPIPEEEEKKSEQKKDEEALVGWRKWITLGGRTRVSTAILLLLFFFLLIMKGLTVQTGEDYDGRDGWLAPSRPTSSVAPQETPEPAPTTFNSVPEPTPTVPTTTVETPTEPTTEQSTPAEEDTPTEETTQETSPEPTTAATPAEQTAPTEATPQP